jgi:hypothetical protein
MIPDFGTLGTVNSAVRRGLGPGCIADSDLVLDYYNIRSTYAMAVGILVAFLVGLTAITYVFLYRGARRQGGSK